MEVIKDNLFCLYDSYNQHKLLFNYYQANKDMKTKQEIKERIEYIKKNKIKQRDELSTLMWVIGELDLGEDIDAQEIEY